MNQSAEKAARDTARRASRREGWGWARGGMRVEESLAGGGHRGRGSEGWEGTDHPTPPPSAPSKQPPFPVGGELP